MGQPNIRKCIQTALQDLPALPDVVNRILAETEKEDVSAQHIENLARSDQALVAKILRVVNSAYYGLPGQVSSLNQAIVILGMHQVRNLVLSISALSLVKARTSRQREILKAFWLHGMSSAAGAQYIARRKSLAQRDVELAFVGGLLHDVGKLFLFCNFTETYQEVVHFAHQKGVPMHEAEMTILGMSHPEVGRELGMHWRYPEALTLLVSRHEGPFGGDPVPALYSVHIADRLSGSLYTHQAGDAEPPAIEPEALEWLDWSEEQMAGLREQMADAVKSASSLFGMLTA